MYILLILVICTMQAIKIANIILSLFKLKIKTTCLVFVVKYGQNPKIIAKFMKNKWLS